MRLVVIEVLVRLASTASLTLRMVFVCGWPPCASLTPMKLCLCGWTLRARLTRFMVFVCGWAGARLTLQQINMLANSTYRSWGGRQGVLVKHELFHCTG